MCCNSRFPFVWAICTPLWIAKKLYVLAPKKWEIFILKMAAQTGGHSYFTQSVKKYLNL